MSSRVKNDLGIGIKTYYGVPDKVANRVAKKILRWTLEQLTDSGIAIPNDGDQTDEQYSLVIARIVQSEAVAPVVAFER